MLDVLAYGSRGDGCWSDKSVRMIPILIINLERSRDRWAAISASGEGLDLRRVEAVDGHRVPAAEWQDFDPAMARSANGRTLGPGEYGCYRSHLRALSRVVDEGLDLAIIAEDDILLNPELPERALAIAEAAPHAGVVKLVNHRTTGFRRSGVSARGDVFGRCLHGPQASAACYLVTRDGATRLLQALATMWLPWDVALERGWSTGVPTYTTEKGLVEFGPYRPATTIDARYAETKPLPWRRIGALVFRTGDLLRRVAYALEAAR